MRDSKSFGNHVKINLILLYEEKDVLIVEENLELNQEQAKKNFSRKWMALAVVVCLLFGACAWYFAYFTKTPAYSLNIVRESVQKHDVAKFKKHVDLDSLLSRAVDDAMEVALQNDSSMNEQQKMLVNGFIKMLKAPITSMFKEGILRYVETGKWEDENRGAEQASEGPQVNPSALAEKSNLNTLKDADFKGIEYTKKDGKTAVVGMKFYNEKLQRDIVLDIQMRELEDGMWQIAEISNLKEYIAEFQKLQSENGAAKQ